MIHVALSKAQVSKKPPLIHRDYKLRDQDIDWVLIDMSGRYPVSGWAVNKVSKELCFVVRGKGEIILKGDDGSESRTKFFKNDVLLIPPNVKYHWQAKCRLGISCSPAWTSDQHETVED